jgi:molybdenum cofactor cytidylyltransferase
LSSESDARIAAVILAAGMSRRMGTPKALLPLADKPLIHHVVQAVRAAGSVSPIIVVTGHRADAVAAAVECTTVRFVNNPHHETAAMLSSVQLGLAAAATDNADGILIALGDQPTISPKTIQALIDIWREEKPVAVLPVYDGKRGHPILISRAALPEILALEPHDTLKTFITRHADQTIQVEVDDPSIAIDVDTPEDYQRLVQSFQGRTHVANPKATA